MSWGDWCLVLRALSSTRCSADPGHEPRVLRRETAAPSQPRPPRRRRRAAQNSGSLRGAATPASATSAARFGFDVAALEGARRYDDLDAFGVATGGWHSAAATFGLYARPLTAARGSGAAVDTPRRIERAVIRSPDFRRNRRDRRPASTPPSPRSPATATASPRGTRAKPSDQASDLPRPLAPAPHWPARRDRRGTEGGAGGIFRLEAKPPNFEPFAFPAAMILLASCVPSSARPSAAPAPRESSGPAALGVSGAAVDPTKAPLAGARRFG